MGPSATEPSLKPQCCFHRASSRRGRRSPPPPPVRRTPGTGDYVERDIFREDDIARLEESPTSSTPPPSPPPPPSFASRRGLLQRKEFSGGLEAEELSHPPCSAPRAPPKRWRLMLSLSQSTPDEEEVAVGGDEEEEETGTDPSDEGGFMSNGVSILRGNTRPVLR